MATTVGELNVKLNLELSRLDGQIKAANAKIAKMGKGMGADVSKAARAINSTLSTLGVGIGVGALTAFGKSVIDFGSKLGDLATQAGISSDAFQVFAAVGRDAGISGETIANSFVKLGSTIQDAAEGSKQAQESLAKLGLTAAGLKALRPEQQFQLIAAQIQNATDKEKAFNAALDILGSKNAPKLREVLQRLGTEGFGAISKQTEKVRFNEEQLKTLDDAGDKLQRVADLLKVIGGKGIVSAIDSLTAGGSIGEENPIEAARKLYEYNLKRFGAKHPVTERNLSELNSIKAGGASFTTTEGRSAPIGQAVADAEVASLKELAKAAEEVQRVKDLGVTQDATRQRIAAQDGEINMALAKSFGEVREKVYASEKAWDDYANSVKDALDPHREFVREEAKLLALVDKGLITMNQAGAYLDAISDPGGESGFKKVLSGAEAFKDGMFQVADSIADRFSTAFADLVVDGEASFNDLKKLVLKSIIELTTRLTVINPILNYASSLFGASGNALPVASFFSKPAADGGFRDGSKPYLIGEQGPELFNPGTSGTVIPNNKLSLGGGGGTTIINNYSFATGVQRAELMPVLQANNARQDANSRDLERRRKR